MEFSKREYWSGLPFLSPGDLPDPGIESVSPALTDRLFTTEPPGKPYQRLTGPSYIKDNSGNDSCALGAALSSVLMGSLCLRWPWLPVLSWQPRGKWAGWDFSLQGKLECHLPGIASHKRPNMVVEIQISHKYTLSVCIYTRHIPAIIGCP